MSYRRPALLTALLAAGLGLLLTAVTASAVELREFSSPEQRERFKDLSAELRCLVCQNQSLADSDADLAKDLRQQVHEMLDKGHTDDEIIDYMVARYGNFVRYKPPFSGFALILWIGPFVLVVLGLVLLFGQLRKRNAQVAESNAELTPEERAQLAGVLGENSTEQGR